MPGQDGPGLRRVSAAQPCTGLATGAACPGASINLGSTFPQLTSRAARAPVINRITGPKTGGPLSLTYMLSCLEVKDSGSEPNTTNCCKFEASGFMEAGNHFSRV